MRPLPMLATTAAPFDAADYAFEVKWDGVRCLAAVEQTNWCLWGRHGVDYTARYPELTVLRHLPAGTVVDGELVVLRQGRADLPALLRRHQRRRPLPASYGGEPVRYVLFDLLYTRGQASARSEGWRARCTIQPSSGWRATRRASSKITDNSPVSWAFLAVAKSVSRM